MANKLVCQGCDGEGRIEVSYGQFSCGAERIGLEDCDDCGGTGFARCDGCGDDAVTTYDGLPMCQPCHDAEAEWDAAESVMPEVRP